MQNHNKKYARKLLKLFDGGRHWAKNAFAYSVLRGGWSLGSRKKAVSSRSPLAKSWCLSGACSKLEIPRGWLEHEIATNTKFRYIPMFNDKDGWKPVNKLLSLIAKQGTAKGFVYPKV